MDASRSEGRIDEYGRPIISYLGTGRLIGADGTAVLCEFEAGQLASGRAMLHCRVAADALSQVGANALNFIFGSIRAEHFEGETLDSINVQVSDLFEVNRNGLADEEGWKGTFTFSAGSIVTAKHEANPSPTLVAFGLTNYLFVARESTFAGVLYKGAMSVELEVDGKRHQVLLNPIAAYLDVERRLKVTKGIEVTCEAIVRLEAGVQPDFADEMMTGLCYVLSVARGSKIQWIYRRECDPQLNTIRTTHYARVTKPYVGLALLDPRAGHDAEIKLFVEAGIRMYFERRDSFRLSLGTIDLYLDAKQEQDYLETRAVKLAIAVEALKHAFLNVPDSGTTEYLIGVEAWERLVTNLHVMLREMLKATSLSGLDNDTVSSIINENKLRGLNRRGFPSILRKLLRYLGLKLHDLDLFVKSRNTLVHQGTFYTNVVDENERGSHPALSSPVHEYRFILHFVDKIFLRLLDYRGSYIDWSRPEGPQAALLE